MGKFVLIGLVLIVVILSTVMVSVRNRSEVSVDDLALRTTIQEANLLAKYAMQFGIRILNDRAEVPNLTELEANAVYKKTFSTDFRVKDGVIDSLKYALDSSDNVVLDAFVTYSANDNSVSSISRAVLEVPPPDTVRMGNVDNAISAKGPIEIQGKASSKKGIHGDVLSEDEITYQNSQANFDGNEVIGGFPAIEDIFGVGLEELRAIADYVGTNPNPVEGITFVEGDFGYNTSNGAIGSGILVVDGDLTITGTIDFTGIIWVTGTVNGLGNGYIFGAIFAAGIDLSETGGSFLLEFDNSLSGRIFTNNVGTGPYRILAVYDDYRN